jgi:polysaccharide export outer membrane protein
MNARPTARAPLSLLSIGGRHASRRAVACAIAALLLGSATLAHGQAGEALGAGDMVRITVFQNPDLTTETRISQRGVIMFPLIGEVGLVGRTPISAANLIARKLDAGGFVRNPQVNVAVTDVRSRQVSVLGQVGRPGRYVLDGSGAKLTDILALAGGITATGDDSVTITGERDGKPTQLKVELQDVSGNVGPWRDIELQNGDTIYVPRAPVFYIYGEVQRPGAYRLEPDMVVMQALSVSGGLTPRGTERGLTIHRRTPDAVHKFSAGPLEPVQRDDVIYVKESLF